MRRRRQLPSYIQRIALDAGPENVFWATARSPGRRPEPGQTLPEWRNRVVGSDVSASQSTGSNQPIWQGDRLEFGGDDVFPLQSVPNDPDDLLFIWSFPDGISSIGRVFAHLSGGAPFILVTPRPGSDFLISLRDSSGNKDNAAPGIGPNQRHVGAIRCDLRSNTVLDFWLKTSNFFEKRVPLISFSTNGDFSSSSTQIGAEDDSSPLYIEGGMNEVLYLTGGKVEASVIIDAIEKIWSRHD